jgi:hypothetical protein
MVPVTDDVVSSDKLIRLEVGLRLRMANKNHIEGFLDLHLFFYIRVFKHATTRMNSKTAIADRYPERNV